VPSSGQSIKFAAAGLAFVFQPPKQQLFDAFPVAAGFA
jgi:hypothetical protein